jgi:acylphosphatase
MKHVYVVVSGRVQGVYYRASLQREATRLGLVGYVANLADGTVEFYAEGTGAAIDALVAWCHRGPPLARVANVRVEVCRRPGPHSHFRIL